MRYVKDSDYATSGSFNQTPSTYPSTEIALFNKPILKTPGGSSAVAIKPCISVGFSRYLRLGFQACWLSGLAMDTISWVAQTRRKTLQELHLDGMDLGNHWIQIVIATYKR